MLIASKIGMIRDFVSSPILFIGLLALLVGGFFSTPGKAAAAPNQVVATRDALVYKDGDRVQGKLLRREGEVIVFRADRFGELRVKSTDAVVIPADQAIGTAKAIVAAPKPAAAKSAPAMAAAAKKAKEAEADRVDEERMTIWDHFSPALLTARVRNYFGPWHGRLAFSTEVVSDAADRNTISADGTLRRKWQKDEVQMNARFDYAETNQLATTDMVKGSGLWRHDFRKTIFGQYRPTVEWNRTGTRNARKADYLLVQQEIGVGVTVITKPSRKVRTGVSQNLFDVWVLEPLNDHTSRGVVSFFEETEFALPWRMLMTQRGVWYPVSDQKDGWENRIELNKKLTETLSTSVRHEFRRNNPDGSAQDYTRLRLLFGLDF